MFKKLFARLGGDSENELALDQIIQQSLARQTEWEVKLSQAYPKRQFECRCVLPISTRRLDKLTNVIFAKAVGTQVKEGDKIATFDMGSFTADMTAIHPGQIVYQHPQPKALAYGALIYIYQ